MTALRAKLFNEENLIKEKMKKMEKDYVEKIGALQVKKKKCLILIIDRKLFFNIDHRTSFQDHLRFCNFNT